MIIAAAIDAFLIDLADTRRSANTIRSYKNGLHNFRRLLEDIDLDPEKESTAQLTELHVREFLSSLGAENRSKATINIYLAAVRAYIEFLDEQELVPQINTSRLGRQLRKRVPRPGRRLPQFPREEIEKVLAYAENLVNAPADDEHGYLINLRDRAFILALADTGLRVHEACNLKRKDVDWHEGRAIIIGKDDQEAVVRFSVRALTAMKHYLIGRSPFDQRSGRQLPTLPVFTGHGPNNLKKLLELGCLSCAT
jgi:site-specific recombinase XerD